MKLLVLSSILFLSSALTLEGPVPILCPPVGECPDGTKPQKTGTCDYLCVPDAGDGATCKTTDDCGTLHCFTAPCPQPVCLEGQCVFDGDPCPIPLVMDCPEGTRPKKAENSCAIDCVAVELEPCVLTKVSECPEGTKPEKAADSCNFECVPVDPIVCTAAIAPCPEGTKAQKTDDPCSILCVPVEPELCPLPPISECPEGTKPEKVADSCDVECVPVDPIACIAAITQCPEGTKAQKTDDPCNILCVPVEPEPCPLPLISECPEGTKAQKAVDSCEVLCIPVEPEPCPLPPLVKCPKGTEPHPTDSCNIICINKRRRKRRHQCRRNSDCGVIQCFTSPCPQPVCRKRKCVEEYP